jgi:hypothetical protein
MAPMSTLPRRIAAIATLLLAGAMVVVLFLGSLGVPPPVGPLASPTPPVATPTAPQPSPSGSADALEVFARIERQVSELRALPPPDIGAPEVISREQLATELEAIFDETWSAEQLASDNLTLRAMGLLTAEQDIRELTEFLYAGQVLGFYDFEDRRMVVVTDAGITPEAQITYAHEFTHAMQDAAFDIGEAHLAEGEDDDAALARLALEEGDATFAMFQWGFGNLEADQLAAIGAGPLPDTSGVPQWMIRQLEFPYLRGATLVGELFFSGGWDAVNAAYDDPPASTEQVLHTDKYADGERPIEVEDPGLAALLGGGWEDAESSTVGEAMLAIWLQEMGVSLEDAEGAAAGWGGDRLSVASGPDGEWAMAWQITWDAPGQAIEFDDAYAEITAELPFATSRDRAGAAETLLLHASSGALLDRLDALLAE